MSRLKWDQLSERLYETGVKECVLYPWTKNAKDAGWKESDIKTKAAAPADFGATYYTLESTTYTTVGSDSPTFDPFETYYKFTVKTVEAGASVDGLYTTADDGDTYTAASGTAVAETTYAEKSEIAAKLSSDWYKGLYTKDGSVYTAVTSNDEYSSSETYYVKVYEDGYGKGVAWNGITAINETPTGAEATDLYADDMKYLSILSAEELEGTVEAYTYPDEWGQCDGSASPVPGVKFGQQARKQFCLSYVTTVGNDTDGNDYGQKLHILYNAKASPSERAYSTINDSPEAITFSWSLKATKETLNAVWKDEPYNLKDTALITIDSATTDSETFAAIKDALQGKDGGEDAHVLLPNDLLNMLFPGVDPAYNEG